MKSDSFFVSAIIPVYNGEVFLKEAFESMRQQDYQPYFIRMLKKSFDRRRTQKEGLAMSLEKLTDIKEL
jgi:GT2 family glycosyltransferase